MYNATPIGYSSFRLFKLNIILIYLYVTAYLLYFQVNKVREFQNQNLIVQVKYNCKRTVKHLPKGY